MERFEGIQIHSHVYREPSFCKGKNVLIVGMGISGGELSSEIAKVANTVVTSTRRYTHM